MERSCRKCALKASPRLLFYIGKQPKTAIACMQEIFLKIRYLKGGIIKNLSKN